MRIPSKTYLAVMSLSFFTSVWAAGCLNTRLGKEKLKFSLDTADAIIENLPSIPEVEQPYRRKQLGEWMEQYHQGKHEAHNPCPSILESSAIQLVNASAQYINPLRDVRDFTTSIERLNEVSYFFVIEEGKCGSILVRAEREGGSWKWQKAIYSSEPQTKVLPLTVSTLDTKPALNKALESESDLQSRGFSEVSLRQASCGKGGLEYPTYMFGRLRPRAGSTLKGVAVNGETKAVRPFCTKSPCPKLYKKPLYTPLDY